jgi:hypothetical protein
MSPELITHRHSGFQSRQTLPSSGHRSLVLTIGRCARISKGTLERSGGVTRA